MPAKDSILIKNLGISYHVKCNLFHLRNYEIGPRLSEYHYGFLLRENTEVNLVSAPIKFGEYIASGVKVITTPYVGDYSSFVEFFNVGILIDLNNIGISSQKIFDDISNYFYRKSHFEKCLNKLSKIESRKVGE